MADVRGTFWCDECRAEYPDALRERHFASHAASRDTYTLPDTLLFWALCLGLGGIVGLAIFSRL